MKSFISSVFFGIRDLLNGISNTVWGVTMLFWCMWAFFHTSTIEKDVIYYFAGVASTLAGIRNDHGQQNTFNGSVNTPGPVNTTSKTTSTPGDTNA